MAKYSTGGAGSGDDGGSCELCGHESPNLRRANVAGADLLVCADCEPHGETQHKDRKKRAQQQQRDSGERNRKKRAAQSAAKVYDAAKGDSSHWVEEGTNYDRDQLPYLVSNYGERVEQARQAAGLQLDELAEELGVDEDDLLAVEQGRASRAGVGGSVISALEERFDIELAE